MKVTDLEAEVLKLDPPTRARLAEVLLRSLGDLSKEEIEALWLDEAERRERAWSETEAIPGEQVMRELRSGSVEALTSSQREELDRRLDELEAQGPTGLSWDEVVAQVRARL